MKIKEIADRTGKSTRTIIRYIDKFNEDSKLNLAKGMNDDITHEGVLLFIEDKSKVNFRNLDKNRDDSVKKMREELDNIPKIKKSLKSLKNEKEVFAQKFDWRFWLVRLPLPLFGLVMSYGVYYFSHSMGIPMFVSIGGAICLEATYLGLAAMDGLNEKEKKKANRIGGTAVILSMFYNSVAAIIHMMEKQGGNLFEELHWIWILVFAIAHSALGLLAYEVGNLILHKRK